MLQKKPTYLANYKVLNAIIYVVSQDEFRRIFRLQTAKETWDLEFSHDGTSMVKQSKL